MGHVVKDHHYTQCLEVCFQCICHVSCDVFLQRGMLGVMVNDSGEFAEPNHAALWNVSHCCSSTKRQKVVLTQGREFDVLYHHQFVMLVVLDCAGDVGGQVGGVIGIPTEGLQPLGNPPRSPVVIADMNS